MKLGPILAGLAGGVGLSALGGGGAGNLAALSPLLMLLLKKKKGNDDNQSPVMNPGAINVTQNPMLRQMGGVMVPPGMAQPPFGLGNQRPPGGMY